MSKRPYQRRHPHHRAPLPNAPERHEQEKHNPDRKWYANFGANAGNARTRNEVALSLIEMEYIQEQQTISGYSAYTLR